MYLAGMKRYIQHEYLKISHFTGKVWDHPVHNHNHFELIFVHQGTGMHVVSGVTVPYGPLDLFLLGPSDAHHFEIATPTTFTFLKFTNAYLGAGDATTQRQWNSVTENLLQAFQQDRLHLSPKIKERIDQLIRLIVAEWQDEHNEHNHTIRLLVQALLSIVQNNISPTTQTITGKHSEKITQLLNYIHEHIHQAEEIQTEQLAAAFDYSKHYLGAYFKEQTGVTLREYVTRYKLHLIENRLKHSSFSLKEISNEFGFSDMSHFNKFFRKHHQMSPSSFRSKIADK